MTLPTFLTQPDPSVYLRNNYVVLDLEVDVRDGRYGSATDKRNHLALACWKSGGRRTILSAWGSEYNQLRLPSGAILVAHNAKYELGWLLRMGVDIGNLLVFDTQIAEYVLLGNLAAGDAKHGLPGVSTSLDACCRRRGWEPKDPIVDLYMKHGVSVADMPRDWVEARCRQDVDTTERLFLAQREELSKRGLLPVLYSRCLLTPVLADIEANGICLDADRVREEYDKATTEKAALEADMAALSGGINWRSNKQAAELIYGKLGFAELERRGKPVRTPDGKPKTDQKTLALLKATTDEQKAFIALRKKLGKVSALLSKNLDYFKGVIDNGTDNIFRAEFNQCRTATHRLSCSGVGEAWGTVPLQNVPRNLARLFRARRTGWYMGAGDSKQLEFRVAAHLGRDANAKTDINDPTFDAHIFSAAAMAGRSAADLLAAYKAGDKQVAELRQAAKSETFKPLYGGQRGTPAQERWYKAFRERYADLAAEQARWVSTVLKDKRLVTATGLVFSWPHAAISQNGYVNVTPSVYNYPVQSLATAEIVPLAVVWLYHMIREAGLPDQILLVNTVHDSVVAEIAPDARETFAKMCELAFSKKVVQSLQQLYGIDFNVPLGVDVKIGTHLGE